MNIQSVGPDAHGTFRGGAIALQPIIDGFSERFRYAITYPGHKAPIKFKVRTAVLHHESADVLGVSVILAVAASSAACRTGAPRRKVNAVRHPNHDPSLGKYSSSNFLTNGKLMLFVFVRFEVDSIFC